VPALLRVVEALHSASGVDVQIIVSTHSPLVLASVEPEFDEEKDAVFTFEMKDGNVTIEQRSWAKQGDVTNWLVSDVFGLKQARSLEAQEAIEAAEAWMRGDYAALPEGLDTQEKIDSELRRVLPGHDDFWPRWIVRYRETVRK
jgi:predicted ATP-binding protein involved in virulence